MNRLRLQLQIVLATFIPLVLFAVLAAAIAGYALVQVPRELVLQRQTALTQVAAAGVAADLRGYVRLLESVAGELADSAGNLPRQQEILAERTRLLGRFTAGSSYLDARGTAVAITSGQEASFGLNYAFRAYFQEVRTTLQPAFSTVLQDQPSGTRVVVIAVPVVPRRAGSGGGEFAGVLLGEFALDRPEWATELELLRTSQGGRAYLVDGAGTIIYHPDPERVSGSIQGHSQLWAIAQGGAAQSALLTAGSSAAQTIASVAPIPGVAWFVVTEEPWDAVAAPVTRYRQLAGGTLVLAIGLALAALSLTVRRVTRPLEALLAEGRRVNSGQPFHPVPVAGPADVRTLLAVVNQMVVRLAEQTAALRGYAAQVVRSQEEERLRLARDLHDETVQELVGLAQRIELSIDALERDPAAARAQLSEVQELAYATAVEVRRMSNSLRPSVLADLGLAAVLQTLTRTLAQQLPQAEVSYEIVGPERRLPAELELTVFRIVQEAFNNVRKHASTATRVNTALFYELWGILLMVEDNGPGFELGERDRLAQAGHLGLTGMYERAQLFGGELKVISSPGEGTTVNLRLPCEAETE